MRSMLNLTLCALALAACSDVTEPGANARSVAPLAATLTPIITGSGHLDRDLGEGPELTTFSYTAVVGEDGTGTGQFQFNFRALDLVVHGYVTCATVAGNRAWIGGVIEKLTSPDPADQELVGTDIWWRVTDNGEGNAAAPDLTTSLLFTLPGSTVTAASWCANQPLGAPNRAVVQGNIQVRS